MPVPPRSSQVAADHDQVRAEAPQIDQKRLHDLFVDPPQMQIGNMGSFLISRLLPKRAIGGTVAENSFGSAAVPLTSVPLTAEAVRGPPSPTPRGSRRLPASW